MRPDKPRPQSETEQGGKFHCPWAKALPACYNETMEDMESFITIAEASREFSKTDGLIMRLVKDALSQGAQEQDVCKKEMRGGRMMFLVNKSFISELISGDETRMREPREEQRVFGSVARAEQGAPAEEPAYAISDLIQAKNEMISTLQKVVDVKDGQIQDLSRKIDQLIERDHETNILLKGLQDKILLLEQNPEGQRAQDATKREDAVKEKK
ncbi:MAG: hypothetical protein HY482_02180 [Candidatus Wildermuthbacteria bacterium]|nr:hypothetical protein [Candidatus Wildermuthbacteria bacterium]